METRDMVRMANQIAGFFEVYGREQAIKETAGHLKSFWEPRMRAQLHEHIVKGGEGLSPIVVEAAKLIAPAPVP
jgi:formate dehydrogenase subunit delta